MNISMYRAKLPYDIVFELPESTCRYCGRKEDDYRFFATGWIVNESMPNDTVIQIGKDNKKIKNRFRAFTHDILCKFPYFYVTVPVCRECFQRWYVMLRVRRRKYKMVISVPILGRVLYVNHVDRSFE